MFKFIEKALKPTLENYIFFSKSFGECCFSHNTLNVFKPLGQVGEEE